MPGPQKIDFDSCLGDRTEVTYVSSRGTESHAACEAWVDDFYAKQGRSESWVGFDVEWTANTVRGQQRNPVATLQLGYRDISTVRYGSVPVHRALVWHLLHFNASACGKLKELLESPDITKVGVGIDDDVNKLRLDHNLSVNRCVDLGAEAVKQFGWSLNHSSPGLKALCERCLPAPNALYKPDNIWQWNFDRRPLNENKIKYAATDAVAGWRIFETFIIACARKEQDEAVSKAIEEEKRMEVIRSMRLEPDPPGPTFNFLFALGKGVCETEVTYISSRDAESQALCEQWVDGFYANPDRTSAPTCSWLGLDVEWAPQGQVGDPVVTLQLGYRSRTRGISPNPAQPHNLLYKALVVHLPHFDAHACKKLTHLLEDNDIIKVGVHTEDDMERLLGGHNLSYNNWFELGDRDAGLDPDFPPPRKGLKALCQEYLGGHPLYRPTHIWPIIKLDKRPLTDSVIEYLAAPAVAGWKVHEEFLIRVQRAHQMLRNSLVVMDVHPQ